MTMRRWQACLLTSVRLRIDSLRFGPPISDLPRQVFDPLDGRVGLCAHLPLSLRSCSRVGRGSTDGRLLLDLYACRRLSTRLTSTWPPGRIRSARVSEHGAGRSRSVALGGGAAVP